LRRIGPLEASTRTAWDRKVWIACIRISSTTRGSSRCCAWTGGSSKYGLDSRFLKEWDGLAEVRTLYLPDINQRRRGALAAIYRHISKNLKAGVGYNFTAISERLTELKYNHKGVFVNLVGTM